MSLKGLLGVSKAMKKFKEASAEEHQTLVVPPPVISRQASMTESGKEDSGGAVKGGVSLAMMKRLQQVEAVSERTPGPPPPVEDNKGLLRLMGVSMAMNKFKKVGGGGDKEEAPHGLPPYQRQLSSTTDIKSATEAKPSAKLQSSSNEPPSASSTTDHQAGPLKGLMGVSAARKKFRAAATGAGESGEAPPPPIAPTEAAPIDAHGAGPLKGLMGVSAARKKFRAAAVGTEAVEKALLPATAGEEADKQSPDFKGVLGVSVAKRRFHGDTSGGLDVLEPLEGKGGGLAPIVFKGFKGIMGVSTAMQRFRSLRMLKFADQEGRTHRYRGGRSRSSMSSDSEDVACGGLTFASRLAASALLRARQAEAERQLLYNPPKHLAIVMAAKRGDWVTLEKQLKECKRGNPRINTADPRTGLTALMLTCQHSCFLLVRQLCDLAALMNLRSDDRQTALHYAATEGHEEIVKILLRHQADPNLIGGKEHRLPLHIAASRSSGLIAAQHLLKFSLLECRLVKDKGGNLPITYAVEGGFLVLVKEMLRHYAKEQVTWRNERTGDYLVHMAARQKNVELMTILANEGKADMNVQNNDGQTPLHISAKQGDETMIKLLQPFKAEPDIIDRKERTPLHVAAENGYTSLLELLVERYHANVNMRTKDGSTLMHLAADRGYADTVLAFVNRGVPLNMPNKSGLLCLHMAAQNGHLQVVKVLIKKGSRIDARTKDGYTPLHLAVLNNKPEIIQLLLGFGAKVDLKGGPLKEAPLHIAARLPDGYQCADMLLKSGALVNNATEETLETPLHIAAKSGSAELLKLLLEEGADPMRLNSGGESALHYAVRNCWFEIAKAIVTFVNDKSSGREATNLVNLANYEGETCFHLAAELGKSQTHNPFEDVDIVRLLLENGADPLTVTKLTNEMSLHYCCRTGNPDIFQEIARHLKGQFQLACNRQDRMGWSPLMTACDQGHAAVAEILLSNGARADVFDEYGKAALHLAAENGHMECCEMLLKFKAFVNAKSKLGITPLHFAAASGYANLVKMLIRKYHATLSALSLDKKTALHMAAGAGCKEVCLLLMDLRADATAIDALGQNPLHMAAENNHSDVVKLFIKYKPELVTAASKSGMTCAHIAAKNGSEAVVKLLMQFNKQLVTSVRNLVDEALPLHLAVSGSHENVVRLLIDAGSSPVAENQEGMTAIHMAAKEGDMEVLQAIISSSPRGALKTNSAKNGLSPLHLAAFYGKSEIVRELLTRVDVNSKTDQPQMASVVSDPDLKAAITIDYGLTSLHMASLRGHENVVRLVLNISSVQTEVVTDLLARVPLHYACQQGHPVVVSLLMSRSAGHLKAQDKMGRYPLHLAAENGHADMVSMLIALGADVNCSDLQSWTPLHLATRNGFLNVIKILIEAGASPTLKTSDEKVALAMSVSGGHVDVMHYLLDKEHDTDELIEDNVFLTDLMIVSKTTQNEALDEFVMHSKAPLDTAAKLAKLYRDLAFRDRERAKDLNELARYCQRMATKILGIASTIASPSTILRARDSKGKQLLDSLLENDMKEVVEHASVQRYLSDIWAGRLSNWPSSRFTLLFVGFLFFPPLLCYFVFPLRHHSYHRIPVIKFMSMIVSHLYLIFLLIFIAAIPFHPIVYREDFFPTWYELLLLSYISGMLVAELTKSGASTGLGSLRYVIIFSSLVAAFCQIGAIILDLGFEGEDDNAMLLMYMRNFMLSFAIFFAILLILDFLLIHHLFGPFGIIISRVMTDTVIFIFVLFIFLIAFTVMACCLYTPITKSTVNDVSNDIITNDINVTNESAVDLIAPEFAHPPKVAKKRRRRETKVIPPNEAKPPPTKREEAGKRRKCRLPKKQQQAVATPVTSLDREKREAKKKSARRRRDADDDYSPSPAPSYDDAGRLLPEEDEGDSFNNLDYNTVHDIFGLLLFSMYQLIDPSELPIADGAPEWSNIMMTIYLLGWLLISQLVLLPLLIAALTETYKTINFRSVSEWKFGRAKLIRAMIKMPSTPPPFNLFVRPYLYIVSVARHGKMMCTAYAPFFAAEDEHEGSDESMQEGGTITKATGVQHPVIERLESVLDWSVVVRRYNAAIKGGLDVVETTVGDEDGGVAAAAFEGVLDEGGTGE